MVPISKTKLFIAGCIILVGLAWLTLMIPFEHGGKPKQPDIIKVGVILPLTGNLASIGVPGKNALELAFNRINQQQTDFRYEVIYEDSKGSPKDGVTAAQKLLSVDKAQVVFATLSSVSLAIAPIIQERNALLFASAISTDLLKEGDGIFRFFPSTQNEVAVWLDRIKSKNYKRVAMLYMNAEFSLEEKKQLEASLPNDVMFIAESFEANSQDLRTQLTKLKQSDPDVIVISGIGSNYVSLMNQLNDLNISPAVIGDFDFALSIARNAARKSDQGLSLFDGVEFAMINIDSTSSVTQDLIKRYRERYRDPEYDILNESEALFAYDAANLLNERAQKIGVFDISKLKDQLQNITQYSGVSGNIKITNRSADIPLVLARYRNGEIEIVK